MGNCSSRDDDAVSSPKSVRVAKDVIIHEKGGLGSPIPKDSVKGILLKDGASKLRTLSRVSWRDIGALAGAALPEDLDGDESVGLQSRLSALGAPDLADVAAALQLVKGSTSGGASTPDLTAQDSTARAADGVLLALAVGATALSQRAAATRAELKTMDVGPLSPETATEVASKLEAVAASAAEAGKQREALSLCLHAHSLTSDAMGPDSPQAAHCLVRVARVLQMMGRLPLAEMLAKHAAQQTAKGFGLEHRAPAEALMLVGEVLGLQGRFEEARTHLSVALELYICAVGRQSAETADIYMRLGELHKQRMLNDEAARLFRQALNTRKRVLGPRAPETASALEALAGVMHDSKQYVAAEQMLQQLVQMHLDMNGGANSAGGIAAMARMATVQAADGRDWEAEATLKRAQAAAAKLYGAEHPSTQGLNLDLARLLMRRKDAVDVHLRTAEQLLRGCLRQSRGPGAGGKPGVAGKAPPSQAAFQSEEGASVLTAEAQVLLADLVTRKGRHDEAERLLTQALEVLTKAYGAEHTATVGCMCALAASLAQRGRSAAGEPLARKALAAATAVHGESHPLVAACMVALADNLTARSETIEAHSMYRAAHRVLSSCNGTDDEETLRVKQLAEQLEKDGGWVQA